MTLAPAVPNTRDRIVETTSVGPHTETLSSARSAITYLSELGDWTFTKADPPSTTTKDPPSTPDYAYPTGTDIYDIRAECYSDYDQPDNAAKFSVDNSYEAVVGFCERQFALRPDDVAKIYEYQADDYYVWAIMGWADDQSGCGDKETLYPSGDDQFSYYGCLDAFGLILQDCEGPDHDDDVDVYEGGGWVLDSGSGCVLVRHFATTDRSAPLRTSPELPYGPGANVTDIWGYDPDSPQKRLKLSWNVTVPEEFKNSPGDGL